ncbi:MAG: cation:proton antiporter [Alphaproteobacteria bacterium]|nr:cation:proton antiporter [Alphaproteobacteria bacterium]
MAEATQEARGRLAPYVWLVLAVAGLAVVSDRFGDEIVGRLAGLEDAPAAPVLAAIALFGFCSFASFYASWKTPLPSFVVAIALGMAGHALFAPIVANTTLVASLVTVSAAAILFGGGLEMPLKSFLRLFVKIALLAVPGVLITGFALSWVVGHVAALFGIALAPIVIVLLGAILASTDPAAIIPLLEHVRFKRRAAKDIVVAESALNDVVGTLLTSAFLKLPLAGIALVAAYRSLASPPALQFLANQGGYGLLFGVAGYGLLLLLSRMKRRFAPYGADQVYFLATPILAFAGAALFGGSGFLAAFVAGLLYETREHMARIERFFSQIVDGVAKPLIFVLVGALADPHALVAYAPVGILAAMVFMAVLRPVMVFLMLGPYLALRARGLTLQELLFISFVRETGAIPAVLLVTAVARVAAPVDGLVEIGMWVILMTLIVAPPFTPYLARKLGLTAGPVPSPAEALAGKA